jgi:hypothetical protein
LFNANYVVCRLDATLEGLSPRLLFEITLFADKTVDDVKEDNGILGAYHGTNGR